MNAIAQVIQDTAPFSVVILFLFFHLLTGLSLWRGKERMPLFWWHVRADGQALERRLNRPERPASVLRMRGTVVVIVLAGMSLAIGAGADILAQRLSFGFIFQLLILASAISVMETIHQLRRVSQDEDQAAHAVFRQAIEKSARHMNDYLVAPVFYYCVWESKAVVVYIAVAALAGVLGPSGSFGSFAGRMARVVNFVPARLSALLFIVAALFVRQSSPLRALRTIYTRAQGSSDPDVSSVLAAVAGSLGITLAGPPLHYEESIMWLGPAESSAKVTVDDVHRARMLFLILFICVIFCLLTVLVLDLKFT